MDKELQKLHELRAEHDDTSTMNPVVRAGLYGAAAGALAGGSWIARKSKTWQKREREVLPYILGTSTITAGLGAASLEKLRRKIFDLDEKVKEKKDEKKKLSK